MTIRHVLSVMQHKRYSPLITKDNEERAEAQATVDATPEEVVAAA